MTTSREYEVQASRGYSIITFERSLSECRWGDIERIGAELKTRLTAETRPHCLLDLSKLEYMGSSIVALLVKLWKTVQEHEGGMVIVSANGMTKEVLEVAGLTKIWTVCENRAEAEKAIVRSLPADSANASVLLSVLIGWIAAGCVVTLVILKQRGLLPVSPQAIQIATYSCGGVAGLCGLLAAIRGVRIWRAVGVILALAAVGLIAWLATQSWQPA